MDLAGLVALLDVIPAPRETLLPGTILGYGWATVDLDRAAVEAATTGATAPWQDTEEPLLGARGRRALFRSGSLVLLEPSTEGRLAGWLARHGEGMAAVYLLADPSSVPPGPMAVTAFGLPGALQGEMTGAYQILVRPPVADGRASARGGSAPRAQDRSLDSAV